MCPNLLKLWQPCWAASPWQRTVSTAPPRASPKPPPGRREESASEPLTHFSTAAAFEVGESLFRTRTTYLMELIHSSCSCFSQGRRQIQSWLMALFSTWCPQEGVNHFDLADLFISALWRNRRKMDLTRLLDSLCDVRCNRFAANRGLAANAAQARDAAMMLFRCRIKCCFLCRCKARVSCEH